ncbi:putative HxlR family transcriptional regulator [Gordonia soli NBRC 108243]|uniref:Putative HxlR family transcriptional regulator n=1 Tax=Gordonia soli NBRC 108243 TaxID=1223545 RepID=M0QMF8_9ACTN|nr:putative HxlR family transcriptional regulator [Gordonia soli NBRC 108243]
MANDADEPEAGIYAAMDLLGQRWILRVIWELEPGPLGFLELRRRMGNCSSSMLADRLATLTQVGLVDKHLDKSYELTPGRGTELGAVLENLWQWADANATRLTGALRSEAGENARRRR